MNRRTLTWAERVEKAQAQIRRHHEKRDARIATLASLGIKAEAADLNGVRIGAADIEKVIRALRQAKAVPR